MESKRKNYFSRSRGSSSSSKKKEFLRSLSNSNPHKNKEKIEGEKKLFPIDFFIGRSILEYLKKKNDFKIFQEIKSTLQIEVLDFNNDLKIPELDGKVLRIFDRDMNKKCDAFYKIVQEISLYQQEVKKSKNVFSVILLVPEGNLLRKINFFNFPNLLKGMVSLLIGSKGKQISSIMKASKAEIVVNQPIHKMKHRTVKVEG